MAAEVENIALWGPVITASEGGGYEAGAIEMELEAEPLYAIEGAAIPAAETADTIAVFPASQGAGA